MKGKPFMSANYGYLYTLNLEDDETEAVFAANSRNNIVNTRFENLKKLIFNYLGMMIDVTLSFKGSSSLARMM